MQQQIAELKPFSHEELFYVLETCAEILAIAYQDTLDKQLDLGLSTGVSSTRVCVV